MITAFPDAPIGCVKALPVYSPEDFKPSDAVLCRNTAPLVSFAFSAIKRRLGVRILGRDIAGRLKSTIEDLNCTWIEELVPKLQRAEQSELKRAQKNENQSAVAAIRDRYATLALFVNEAKDVREVLQTIDKLFADKAGTLTLSTGHKAKGLEWERVFILDRCLCPSPWASQPWQLRQERNLFYVMITRAKLELTYITSNSWKTNQNKDVTPTGGL